MRPLLVLLPLLAAGCFQADFSALDVAAGSGTVVATLAEDEGFTYAIDVVLNASEAATETNLVVQLSGTMAPVELSPGSRLRVTDGQEGVVVDVDMDDELDFFVELDPVLCEGPTCSSSFELQFALVGTGSVEVELGVLGLGSSDASDDDARVDVTIVGR